MITTDHKPAVLAFFLPCTDGKYRGNFNGRSFYQGLEQDSDPNIGQIQKFKTNLLRNGEK